MLEEENAIIREQQNTQIINLRAKGWTVARVAADMGPGWDERRVKRRLAEVAKAVAARNVERVEQARMEQDDRCEYLYDFVMKQLHTLVGDGTNPFTIRDADKLIRAAVTILERQARLLGLDARPNTGGNVDDDWVNRAPLSDVIAAGEKMGLHIPEKFRT